MEIFIIFAAKYLIGLGVLLALLFLFKSNRDIRKYILRFAAISLPLSYLLALFARAMWYDPRPFVAQAITPLIPHVADNGFPSDHTLLLASLASLLSFFNPRYASFLWIITFLVGAARVLAHVHHTADIVGSVCIALISAVMAYVIIERLWNKKKQTRF